MKLKIINRNNREEGTGRENKKENQKTQQERIGRKCCDSECMDKMVNNKIVSHEKQNIVKIYTTAMSEFFNNFQSNCSIQYSKNSFIPQNTKRILLPILTNLKNSKTSTQPTDIIYQPKTIKLLATAYTEEASAQRCQNKQQQINDTYYFNHRIKSKLRKFSSLNNLNQNQRLNGSKFQRRPGFITNRSSSLVKPIQCNSRTSPSASGWSNPKNPILSKITNFQQQISQSKDRISKIRKQLNSIYQMRRHPSTLRLTLN